MILVVVVEPGSRVSSSTHGLHVGRVTLASADWGAIGVEDVADALIHEAVHCMLLMLDYQEPQLLDEQGVNSLPPIESPWTGNPLPIPTYLHACFVWFALAQLWRLAGAQGAFSGPACDRMYARACKGFRRGSLLDRLGHPALSLVSQQAQRGIAQAQEIMARQLGLRRSRRGYGRAVATANRQGGPPATSDRDGDKPTVSRPRRINYVGGLADLMNRWDAEDELPPVRRTIASVNPDNPETNTGTPRRDGPVRIYPRHDPRFRESIEPGVRQLVLQLVEQLNCITYTSCEGHRGPDGSADLAPRHVGIVPRSTSECSHLLSVLRPIAKLTNAPLAGLNVRAVVKRSTVTSEGPDRRCVDILFSPVAKNQETYFEGLDVAYHRFLDLLNRRVAEAT